MKNAEISGIVHMYDILAVHYIMSAKISDILIEHNMKNASVVLLFDMPAKQCLKNVVTSDVELYAGKTV